MKPFTTYDYDDAANLVGARSFMITEQEAKAWIGKPAVIVWDEDDIEISGAGGVIEKVQDGVIVLRAHEDEDPGNLLLNWPLDSVLRIETPEGYNQVIRLSDRDIYG